jgi:hydroxyacylglutathione hydrolase
MATSSTVRVEVRVSGIWQTNSIVVAADGGVLVVDPAFFPRELDELAALARDLRSAATDSTTVAFTHGHWDHVAGWRHFPGARVVASAALARAVAGAEPEAERNLAQLAEYDARWYVPRPEPPSWPPSITGLGDGDQLQIGRFEVEAISLPGHSADGLGLLVPEAGLLLPGDHLSPCEIPFVEDVDAYRTTLLRLRSLLGTVDRIVPGHGAELDRQRAATILDADLAYLEALADHASRGDAAGALAMPWPRAMGVPDMADRHRENCQAVGLPVDRS